MHRCSLGVLALAFFGSGCDLRAFAESLIPCDLSPDELSHNLDGTWEATGYGLPSDGSPTQLVDPDQTPDTIEIADGIGFYRNGPDGNLSDVLVYDGNLCFVSGDEDDCKDRLTTSNIEVRVPLCFQTIRDGNVLSVDVLVRTSTLTNENWHAYYRRL